ncbi:MAG TPA: sensor histidine kinase [Candidatus Methylomirabilis sp.]|nr:sensor histidine kinase [Candidatus Methylomirabilis sp.]
MGNFSAPNAASAAAREDVLPAAERSRKLRSLLLISFGWLLVLLIGAGFDALLSVRRLDNISQQVSRRFTARNQALSTIVISVRAYDDQLERFLLQDQLGGPTPAPSSMEKDIAAIRAALLGFPLDNDPDEQLLIDAMQQQLLDEENAFTTVTSWPPNLRQQRAFQFIAGQLIPWRTHVYELSQQISALNARKLALDNLAVATSFQALESRLMWMVAVALIAGVLMSLVSGGYILRLERQGRLRYQALARSRLELEGLSARLVEAQEQERRSISRELHDEVGQTLGALLVEIGQLSKLAPAQDEAARSQIAHIKSVAGSAVKSIRDMALLLRPPMLDDLGLVPALEWQAREISRRSEMEVEVHSENVSESLSDETKVCVYRLVQEALNNAARHAAAKNAKVTVSQNSAKITVQIKDDGRGFDPHRQRGMGILGMEERVKRLGGTLTLESSPGHGATVRAELPSNNLHSSSPPQ